jgi:aryl-alcohol dehydrogenase-like predicted oxidoreductase
MDYRKIPGTEIEVSTVALGTWVFAGDSTWGEQEKKESIDTVHAALDEGINFFDTAEGYGSGKSEEILGEALKGRRDKAVIATKISDGNPTKEKVVQVCEESLERLGTDYLDLFQLHWPRSTVPFEESMEGLQKLLDDGKIRAAGVSNFGVKDLNEITEYGRVNTNQLAYNIFFRAIEYEIQPECAKKDIGILCYSSLAQGLATGKFKAPLEIPAGRRRTRYFKEGRKVSEELFRTIDAVRTISERIGQPMARVTLAWLISRRNVISVLAGARNIDQVRENASAGSLELPDDIRAELTKASFKLKEMMGKNPDMWQMKSRIK